MGYLSVRMGIVLLNGTTTCSRRAALGATLFVESMALVGAPRMAADGG